MRLQMHPGILPTRMINLEDLGRSAVGELEEHKCQNANEKDLLDEPEEGPCLLDGKGRES